MPSFDSSKLGESATGNFLDLPKGIRNNIYEKVLAVPHPIYLFQEPNSRVETFAPQKPSRWLAILLTNRQICHEASVILYGTNHFHLVDTTQQQLGLLRSFLDCIGSVNAASLSHLCINFPVTEEVDGQTGEVKLRDDSLQSLKLLRERCTNLSKLETLVHNKSNSVFRETGDSLEKALFTINAQLKAISSLEKVIVRVVARDKVPTTIAKNIMQGLGWVLFDDGNQNQ
ncbi:hypothetical protein IG631_01504 [Alternaria alternata]|nr:hypothetical protein IG631_01504 [Alternaria alternata]